MLPDSELPPKTIGTINALTGTRKVLNYELSSHCIRNGRCYDVSRAADFMRAYACSIYDFLKDTYARQILAIRPWEGAIAVEAVGIVLACWNRFEVSPSGAEWISTLHNAIRQHVGRELGARVQEAQAKNDSPASSPSPPAATSEIQKRERLLAEYKAATGNPSNKRIYEAQNSGIYKPEFYQWLKGELPAISKTAKTFENFLRAKKRPIPRKATI